MGDPINCCHLKTGCDLSLSGMTHDSFVTAMNLWGNPSDASGFYLVSPDSPGQTPTLQNVCHEDTFWGWEDEEVEAVVNGRVVEIDDDGYEGRHAEILKALESSKISSWCSSNVAYLGEFRRFAETWGKSTWNETGVQSKIDNYMKTVKSQLAELSSYRGSGAKEDPDSSEGIGPGCDISHILKAIAPLEMKEDDIKGALSALGSSAADPQMKAIIMAAWYAQKAGQIADDNQDDVSSLGYFRLAMGELKLHEHCWQFSCAVTVYDNRQRMMEEIFSWINSAEVGLQSLCGRRGQTLNKEEYKCEPCRAGETSTDGKECKPVEKPPAARAAAPRTRRGSGPRRRTAARPAEVAPPPPAGAEPKPRVGDAVPKRTRPCSANEIAVGECHK